MESKQCKKCGEEKPTTDFPKHKQTKDGLNSWCKSCTIQTARNYNKNHPKKHIQSVKKWKKDNPTKHKKIQLKYRNKLGKGVYGIFAEGECLYVGESKAVNNRIVQHFTRTKNPHSDSHHSQSYLYNALRQHDYIYAGVIENCDNHVEREKYWINKLKPAYNG